ncbi:hypothetical protein ACFFX1_46665 [Dactylosporangium sucinum]|uniref:Uncharacterized protein n=1 Tax=Dactylosporangium sucinum TaxID=1424081 RepID=A0A917UB30_9ACTN|nr:hypothetical protein [Dactylosporangium sucinum]GGM67931.1 hypothetical protein GCM10007977_082180 [Dactylosporangium sucinum]
MIAILVRVAAPVVAAVLYGVGAPWWVAAPLALVPLGALGIATGHRRAGAALLVAAAATGLYGLHELEPDLPLWIAIVGGAVVEGALVVLVWALIHRLRRPGLR